MTSPRAGAPAGPPPSGAPDGPAALRFMGPGTLSRQLVVRITVLVAIVAIALSAVGVVAMAGILQAQQDEQLTELAHRASRPSIPGTTNTGGDPPGTRFDQSRQDGFLEYRAVYQMSDGTFLRMNATVQDGNSSQRLGDTVIARLSTVPAGSTTIALDGLGAYRLFVFTDALGRIGIVGLPASLTTGPILKLLAVDGLFVLGSIGAAYAASRFLTQRSLKALQRMASTAHQVSQLELHSGEVAVLARVSTEDTDPRSEVGQVGLAFNHMLDNVEGALEARQRSEMKVRQFVADASHELRNPLASIRGYAELTRRERDEVPETTSHALGRIESESERMSALVEDLLLLARLDSGPNLALTPTHLNEIVANAVSDAQVAGPDQAWSLTIPEDEVVAVGDPFRLLQVITNLLANARTHTPSGTEVHTTLAGEGDVAVITVADNGPGIPEAIRGKVFERFTRADAARARQGNGGSSTGLGLAIVAAVVSAHRGTATVDSSSAGTTFTVRIPLAREL